MWTTVRLRPLSLGSRQRLAERDGVERLASAAGIRPVASVTTA
jgi:hypothetical protein